MITKTKNNPKKLNNFFKNFMLKDSLFKNKSVLQSNYTPEDIPHREEQIEQIANILAPALRLERPSNLFAYGKTGTGKTLTIKHVTKEMSNIAKEEKVPLKIIYINCKLKKIADTEYRLIAHMVRSFGKEIPATGLPTDEVYRIFYDLLDKSKLLVIVILDEMDQLVKKAGDEAIYNLTRINSELNKSQISIIGISNNITFKDVLDPRIKSSLSEEELVFPPYDAIQIKNILIKRAEKAFKLDRLAPGVIEKCAAYAAREHGDARRALELLRVAGEIAERKNLNKVGIEHIDLAEDKIEHDYVLDVVQTQPKQFQATLYSILILSEKLKKASLFTGDIYNFYKKICNKVALRPLTQRRISDIIGELDMLGIINAKVISKGRYGRTREITLEVQEQTKTKIEEILKNNFNF